MASAAPPRAVEVLLGQPLGSELVARIAAVDPRVRVEPAAASGDALAGAEVLVGIPGHSAEGLAHAFRAGRRLRWIAASTAGAGELVRAAAALEPIPAGLAITRATAVHPGPLAEFALLGLLAFRKDLPRLRDDARAKRWPARRPLPEMRGATVVVLGLGGVGREVARLASCFGMRVLGVRRSADGPPVAHVDELHGVAALAALAPRADALVVTLPRTTETQGLVSRELLERLPLGAIVVNVGRGGVVDEPALIDALVAGRLAGAALDVFATEPLPAESPLWELDNVILAPHTAALTDHEDARFVDELCDNLRAYLAGEPLRGLIDPARGY